MSSEHQKTAMFDDITWLPPVETVDDLPGDANDDSVCYVKAENAVYRCVTGVWVRDFAKGAPERGGASK